jgi:hypothetical protein
MGKQLALPQGSAENYFALSWGIFFVFVSSLKSSPDIYPFLRQISDELTMGPLL